FAEHAHGRDGVRDRRMPESGGLREDEDPRRVRRRRLGPRRALVARAEDRGDEQDQERALSHRPFKYSPSGQSSETGWSGPAPWRAAIGKDRPASTEAEKTIFWKRSAETRPEQEQVRSQPPGETSFIASRLMSL